MIAGDITIKINSRNKNHFELLGYAININDIIKPSIYHINKGSHQIIDTKCDICSSDKQMEFRTYYKITNELKDKYYCKKCSYQKNIITNIVKYGTEHPMQNDNIKNKLLFTNNKKYGKNSASMVNEFKDKQKKTNIEKYGTISPMQNQNIKDKAVKTNLIKFGYNHPMKNKDISNKTSSTKYIKYNDKNYNNSNKTKQTNLKRYGVDNPSKNDLIKEKINITKSKSLIDKYPSILKVNYFNKELTMLCDNKENHVFTIDITCFQNRKHLNTTICTICNNGVSSGLEIQLSNFIKENYNGKIIENDRVLIKKELDIYLPELNLAFEFNGLHWHNELNKPNSYHKIKSDMCDEKGIQLIHIWEDDWLYNQNIIKSMIINKLNKTPNKIFGRKTEIREITDNKLIRTFLDENHIQGFVGSQIKLGLFFENELISLMTFGKLRKSMNSKSKNEGNYEMLRFCNKLNTNIIGGASKLFKYFTKNYEFNEITSYADKSYSNGNLYKQLGFKLIHITSPNYYYIINGIRHYRFGFRKDILVKQGYESNKSEHEIMLERKIYRIYNSGNYKYLFGFL